MKTLCLYSGVTLYKTPHLLGLTLADIHPIFRAKKKLIICPDMVFRFMKSTDIEEKKLIFLAILNTTELVEFRVPAMPSARTVEKNFFNLMHTAGWLAFAEATYKAVVAFPQFVVNEQTADLESLSAWIRSCEDIKDQIIKRDINRERAASLEQKAAEIKKEINNATFLHRAFTPALARWALDFAQLKRTDERYNQWVKILCSPLSEAWVYDLETLREIEDYLEEELPAEHPQVISVMAQIRTFILECKKGFTEFAVFNEHDETGESFTIVDDETGLTTPSKHLVDVPTTEPRQSDYPTKVAYLIATAKWRLANRKTTATPTATNSGLTEDSV
jgi:hypothetical protein